MKNQTPGGARTKAGTSNDVPAAFDILIQL